MQTERNQQMGEQELQVVGQLIIVQVRRSLQTEWATQPLLLPKTGASFGSAGGSAAGSVVY